MIDVEFHEIGTVEMVPGRVVNSFRASVAATNKGGCSVEILGVPV